jgi:hypothetical protein
MPRKKKETFDITQAMLDAARQTVRSTVSGPFIGNVVLRVGNTIAVQYPKRITGGPYKRKRPVLTIQLEEVTP